MKKPELSRYCRGNRRRYLNAAFETGDGEYLQALLAADVRISPEELDSYLDRAAAEKKNDFIPLLLDYKQSRYTPQQLAEAERIRTEKEFGLRERNLSDWQRIYGIRRVSGGYVIYEYRKDDPVAELPADIGGKPVLAAEPMAFFSRPVTLYGNYAAVGSPIPASAGPGDRLVFGTCPFEADGRPAPLRWQVLDRKCGQLLMITENVIDAGVYSCSKTALNWPESPLRQWLNGPFLTLCFTEEEKSLMVTSARESACDYRAKPESSCEKLFLLSRDEVNRLLPERSLRRAAPTPFAAAHGAADRGGAARWWLRSPSLYGNCAGYETEDGVSRYHGYGDDYGILGIRPAVWIKITEEDIR